MSFAEEEELLSGYNKWVAERKVAGIDLSPSAYLVDRAKDAAYDKLEEALEYLNSVNLSEIADAVKVKLQNILEN